MRVSCFFCGAWCSICLSCSVCLVLFCSWSVVETVCSTKNLASLTKKLHRKEFLQRMHARNGKTSLCSLNFPRNSTHIDHLIFNCDFIKRLDLFLSFHFFFFLNEKYFDQMSMYFISARWITCWRCFDLSTLNRHW